MSKRLSLALSAVAIVICGCSTPHDLSEKYYMVVGNTKSPYWEEATAGLNRAAAELKVWVSVAGPDTFAPQGELTELKRVVAKKPAGILVSVSDASIIGPEIDAAVAAGIPVITIDSDAPASRRLTFVGTNNYEAGQMGGRLLARQLNGKGSVMIFTTTGQTNLDERLQGYRAALAASPGIQIAEVVDLKGDVNKAFDRVAAVLDTGKPAIDAFVSLESQSAKDVAEVLGRKKLAGKTVIAMDSLAPTLEAINKGLITATIAQKPWTMAYFALRLLADVRLNRLPTLNWDFNKDPHSPMPRFVDTGAALIDKASLSRSR